MEGVVERCRHVLGWIPRSSADSSDTTTTPIFSLEHNKTLNNLIYLISYLYAFGTVECTLVYDIVRRFASRLLPTDVELLLSMMTACGMKMRSDDPSSLKEIILLVQESVQRVKREEREREEGAAKRSAKGGAAKGDGKETTTMTARMDYMLDTLYDLKNNKTKHRRNQMENRETTMKLTKWLRHMKTRFTSYGQPLGVTLDDLLEVEARGRWWIAGARWTGRRPESSSGGKDGGDRGGRVEEEEVFANIRVNDIDVDASSDGYLAALSSSSSSSSGASDLLRLAQARRMNTDVRRQIFATIMSSSDYMDAFERVMKLNLKEKQEREIVYVLVTCCEDEPTYNPFYSHVAQKLCSALPHFKFTFQLAFWDRFKLLTGSSTTDEDLSKMNHAARLLSFLLVRFSLSLAMLKVVDFGTDMPDDLIIFFHSMCVAMFSDPLCVGEDDDVGIERMDAGRQVRNFFLSKQQLTYAQYYLISFYETVHFDIIIVYFFG